MRRLSQERSDGFLYAGSLFTCRKAKCCWPRMERRQSRSNLDTGEDDRGYTRGTNRSCCCPCATGVFVAFVSLLEVLCTRQSLIFGNCGQGSSCPRRSAIFLSSLYWTVFRVTGFFCIVYNYVIISRLAYTR